MKNELFASVIGNLTLLKMTLSDLTDADLLQRPVPGANNGLWQLGHLISAETSMINACAGSTLIELPAGFTDRYKKENAGENDPARLGTKTELLALLERNHEIISKWIGTLTPEQLSAPAPEKLQRMCPTVGHAALLLPVHVAMHVGQLQVLRRMLQKPLLF